MDDNYRTHQAFSHWLVFGLLQKRHSLHCLMNRGITLSPEMQNALSDHGPPPPPPKKKLPVFKEQLNPWILADMWLRWKFKKCHDYGQCS